MADNELLIKINADAKNVTKAYEDIRAKTEDLENSLEKTAKVSAVAFAALSAEVGFSLKAFSEAQQASNELTQALQAQGIYTDKLAESYKGYAEAVQDATGIDDDAITSAQAVAQTYLGEQKVTQDLTFAIADLAKAKKIDLNTAATIVAKTIGTSTNALAREGLQLSDTATQAERYAKTLDFLKGRYDGAAAAASKNAFGLEALKTQFGNFQESVGGKFAPAAESVIHFLTDLFKYVNKSPEITNLVVSVTAAGLAVTALGIALPIAAQGFLVLSAAASAAGVGLTGARLALAALAGATGVGLLIFGITELALHWNTVWPRIVAVTAAAVSTLYGLFQGLGQILKGVFTFDFSAIEGGLSKMKEALVTGYSNAFKELPAIAKDSADKQNKTLEDAAAVRHAKERQEQADRIALGKATQELIALEAQGASAQLIQIKKDEVETIKAILKDSSDAEVELQREKLDRIREAQEQEIARQSEVARTIGQAKLDIEKQYRDLDVADQTLYEEQKTNAIIQSAQSQRDAQQAVYNQALQDKINSNNKLLQEQIKYGAAYAALNQFIRSDEVQGVKRGSDELLALSRSKHSALREIGRAAAIANITIKTAESAMNIYAGFSSIPIVGPALGIAGAAAAIAFGAEQIDTVTSVGVAEGGIITGGRPGVDSVPAMLTPGELVAPVANFEEVVGSVAAKRAAEEQGASLGGVARIELSLTDSLMDFIETKLVERGNIGISIVGN